MSLKVAAVDFQNRPATDGFKNESVGGCFASNDNRIDGVAHSRRHRRLKGIVCPSPPGSLWYAGWLRNPDVLVLSADPYSSFDPPLFVAKSRKLITSVRVEQSRRRIRDALPKANTSLWSHPWQTASQSYARTI